jgi:hypothetical protein
MGEKVKLLTVILSVAVLVSLTMACGLGGAVGPVTEEETPAGETAVAEERCGDGVCSGPENSDTCPQDCVAPTAETPAAATPAQEWPFELDEGALDNLSSYAYSLHFEGLSGASGTLEQSSLDISGRRQNVPTRAEQLSFSSKDGESQTTEFIYIQDQNKLWTRDQGGEWQEIPGMDADMISGMFQAFSLGFWWNTLFTGNPEDVQFVGQETVNGVQTNHYQTADVTNWGFAVGCTYASVQDDIWVAVDGAFPVKRKFDAAGECSGERGEVHFLMEVSDVNQPLNIAPPM